MTAPSQSSDVGEEAEEGMGGGASRRRGVQLPGREGGAPRAKNWVGGSGCVLLSFSIFNCGKAGPHLLPQRGHNKIYMVTCGVRGQKRHSEGRVYPRDTFLTIPG